MPCLSGKRCPLGAVNPDGKANYNLCPEGWACPPVVKAALPALSPSNESDRGAAPLVKPVALRQLQCAAGFYCPAGSVVPTEIPCPDRSGRYCPAGSINAVVPASAFRIVSGQTRVFTKTADSGNALHRHFCGTCGSWIYNPMGGDATQVVLKAGTFDRHEGMQITLNLWTSSRPAWAPLDTSIPCHEKNII